MAEGKRKAGGTGLVKSKIMPHTCVHLFQDQQYGKGMRLFRSTTGQYEEWMCTVCEPTRAQLRTQAYIKGVTLGAVGRLG